MPLLGSTPRPFASDHDRDKLPPGTYLAIIAEWRGPVPTKSGRLYYIVDWEEVVPAGRGRTSPYWIECDTKGIPILAFGGEGKWQRLLGVYDLRGKGAIDTNSLLWRPAVITVISSKGYTKVDTLAVASPEQQDQALDYVDREHPLSA
jgi:hypothetical protein